MLSVVVLLVLHVVQERVEPVIIVSERLGLLQ